jgi:hypothetical protein
MVNKKGEALAAVARYIEHALDPATGNVVNLPRFRAG